MDRVVIVDVLDIVEPYRFPILCSFMAVIFFGICEETNINKNIEKEMLVDVMASTGGGRACCKLTVLPLSDLDDKK